MQSISPQQQNQSQLQHDHEQRPQQHPPPEFYGNNPNLKNKNKPQLLYSKNNFNHDNTKENLIKNIPTLSIPNLQPLSLLNSNSLGDEIKYSQSANQLQRQVPLPQFTNNSTMPLLSNTNYHQQHHPLPPPNRPKSAHSYNNNNNNINGINPSHYSFKTIHEPKTIYKFKSGESFHLYSYYNALKIIGEGSYATVCSVQDKRNNKYFAIKKNKDAFNNIGDAKRILREVKLMKHLGGHPNLMSIVDVIAPNIGTQQSFNDVYIVMPKMHFALNKLIKKSRNNQILMNEYDVKSIIYQIMRGLEYMHSANIIHRDLKPENILINCYQHQCNDGKLCTVENKNLWQVRITDFGLARGIDQEQMNFNIFNGNGCYRNELTEYVVTRFYRAPEVMCCSRLYDEQIDVWSLGCCLGEMFKKRPLFPGNNHLHQLQLIFFHCGTPDNNDIEWVKMKDAKQWIKQLTKYKKKNYKKEFSYYNNRKNFDILKDDDDTTNNNDDLQLEKMIRDLQLNPKMKDAKCGIMSDLAMDFLDKLLVINPNKRSTISKALKHKWLAEVYKENDYYICNKFDIAFENEPILRTNFGVRHMIYEELQNIHKKCVKRYTQNNNKNNNNINYLNLNCNYKNN